MIERILFQKQATGEGFGLGSFRFIGEGKLKNIWQCSQIEAGWGGNGRRMFVA